MGVSVLRGDAQVVEQPSCLNISLKLTQYEYVGALLLSSIMYAGLSLNRILGSGTGNIFSYMKLPILGRRYEIGKINAVE